MKNKKLKLNDYAHTTFLFYMVILCVYSFLTRSIMYLVFGCISFMFGFLYSYRIKKIIKEVF